jgi:hypothetical protein
MHVANASASLVDCCGGEVTLGWAGWCGGRGRAQVAVVLERARMAALETNAC